jgi:hypothetical protein
MLERSNSRNSIRGHKISDNSHLPNLSQFNTNNQNPNSTTTARMGKTNEKIDLPPQYKIENFKEYIEDPIIKLIREDKEKETKRQQEEVIIRVKIEKEKEILKYEISRKQKEIDGRKVTFDADGKMLNIKNIVPDKLANDFAWAR